MSRSRYRIGDPNAPHFFTCTIVGWLPVFSHHEAAQIILDSWSFLQANHRITLYGYVILENHVHFIASGAKLSEEVGDFKSFTARRILDLFENRGMQLMLGQLRAHKELHKTDRPNQLWQEGSHPQQIVDDDMMIQKLEYVHNNPVKRGYVDEPVHWRYSSARNYHGQPGLIPVTTNWRD